MTWGASLPEALCVIIFKFLRLHLMRKVKPGVTRRE